MVNYMEFWTTKIRAFPTLLIGGTRLETLTESGPIRNSLLDFTVCSLMVKNNLKMAILGWTRGLISKRITTGRSTVMTAWFLSAEKYLLRYFWVQVFDRSDEIRFLENLDFVKIQISKISISEILLMNLYFENQAKILNFDRNLGSIRNLLAFLMNKNA